MSRSPMTRPLIAGAAVAALALLAACGTADEPQDAGTSDAGPTVTATPDPGTTPTAAPTGEAPDPTEDAAADAAAPEFGTAVDTESSADALLSVTGLRLGTHEGYDRVVVDLGGTGTPGWFTARAQEAVEDPTGDVIDLGGAGVLAVTVTGLGYPADTGQQELAVGTRTGAGTVVTGAEFTGTFEGQTTVFLGLTDPEAPYRVFLLQDPVRLVVDVQG